jgi:hypothetical protein
MTGKIILNKAPLLKRIEEMQIDKLGLLAEILNDAVGEAKMLEQVSLENNDEGEAFYFSERAIVATELRDLIVKMNAGFFTIHVNPQKEASHA